MITFSFSEPNFQRILVFPFATAFPLPTLKRQQTSHQSVKTATSGLFLMNNSLCKMATDKKKQKISVFRKRDFELKDIYYVIFDQKSVVFKRVKYSEIREYQKVTQSCMCLYRTH